MMRILVAESNDPTLARTLADAGLNVGRTDMTHLGALHQALSGPPDVLVVDVRGRTAIPPDVTALQRRHPRLGVVAVHHALEPAFLLDAMRAGVSEVVAEPGLPEHLVSAVSRVASKQLLAAAGRVYAFVGAKGGVGTTTVAVNAATALGRPGKRALLVDLHEGDGDAATFLNATPSRTIANACDNVHRLDERYLRGLVTTVATHVDLLGATDVRGTISAAALRAVMQRASAAYPFVVIDVSAAHVSLLDAIDALAGVFVVTSQEFVSLKRGRRLADGLKSWCRDGRVTAVLNRFDPASDIGERDVERVLGVDLARTIPNDYPRAAAAMGRGRPVVFGESSPLREALVGLAERLAGEPSVPEEPPRAGFLQRLARVS